jgi:ferredoxin
MNLRAGVDVSVNGRSWRRHLAIAVSTGALVVLGTTGSSLLPQAMALAGSTSGSWTIVSSPDPGTSVYASPSAVTCTGPRNCWAVGTYDDSSTAEHTLAEHYDGTTWSVSPIPTPSATVVDNTVALLLDGVACTSASDCWAVGSYKDSHLVWHMLIEQFSNGAWNIFPSSNPSGVDYAILDAVTCAGAGDCLAVGYYEDDSGKNYTLTEKYDGIGWNQVSSPNPSSTAGALLSGVSCISASDCWAVGSYTDIPAGLGMQQSYTLAEHFNGSTWSIDYPPTRGGSISVALPSVACTSDGNCWAVGSYIDSSLNEGTLAEQYSGGVWTIVSSPAPPGATSVEPSGVACTSDSNCWLVGAYVDSSSDSHTLAEEYDGSAWTIVSSPTPGGTNGESVGLSAVACASDSNCWAVGSYDDSSFDSHTLVEQYEALAITSASAATLTLGSAGTFTVTTTDCWPTPSLSDGGAALPSGVTFTDNGDGTASLAGTPSAGSGGTYAFTITARNGVTPDATQAFTLSVMSPTSLTATATPGATSYGTPVALSATGLPAGAAGTITFTDQSSSTLCSAPVAGGAASCQPPDTLASGTYTVTASYAGDSTHGASVATTSFRVTPDPVLQVSTSGTPSSIPAGDGYTLTVGASLESAGGPAYHEPTLTVSLPPGETFAADPPSPWTCDVGNASTELTCVSTAVTPIGAGTSLGSVSWVVNVSSTAAGPLGTTVAVTDAGDLAAAQSVTATLTSVTATPSSAPASTPPTPAAGSGAGGALPWAPALALVVAGLAALVGRLRIRHSGGRDEWT